MRNEDNYEAMHLAFTSLEQEEFDAAAKMFESYLELPEFENEPLAHYGLATALFRRYEEAQALDLENLDTIIGLYDKSLELDPEFADTYLILGLAHVKKANLLGDLFKDNQADSLSKVKALDEADAAEKCFRNAEKFQENFSWIVSRHLDTLKKFRAAME